MSGTVKSKAFMMHGKRKSIYIPEFVGPTYEITEYKGHSSPFGNLFYQLYLDIVTYVKLSSMKGVNQKTANSQ